MVIKQRLKSKMGFEGEMMEINVRNALKCNLFLNTLQVTFYGKEG